MSGKKRVDKATQLKGSEAEEIIETYLVEQYRPFGVNDIVQNLRNKVSRTNAVKALDNLVKNQRITCKVFGKIPIYVCNEQELAADTNNEKDVSLDAIMQLREELIEIEKDKAECTAQLQGVLKHPPNDELLPIIATKKAEIEEIQRNLDSLMAGWKPEDENLIATIKTYEQNIGKEMKARKVMLNNAIALVKEALSMKNVDEFLEELGFEMID